MFREIFNNNNIIYAIRVPFKNFESFKKFDPHKKLTCAITCQKIKFQFKILSINIKLKC